MVTPTMVFALFVAQDPKAAAARYRLKTSIAFRRRTFKQYDPP
jgi:hypothetical protein